MKRRKFLQISGSGAAASFVVAGFPMKAIASKQMAAMLAGCEDLSDRSLILIQMKGGNDGLNTLVPIDQYDKYAAIRPSIKLKDTALLNLDTTVAVQKQLGIHPIMTEMKALYDAGKLAIMQGVGYDEPNQSHFKSTDLWMTGGDGTPANFNIKTGWAGRYLEATYPDVQGEPIPAMPDPLGIQVGDPKPSLGFHTESQHPAGINLSGQDPAGFFTLVSSVGGANLAAVPASEYGDEILFIQDIEKSTSKYAQRITDVFNAGSNSSVSYPANNPLADQLKTIARLIKGGSKTRIFLTQIGGFDTHSGQVDTADTSIGEHADLLQQLSQAIKAFQDDVEAMGLGEKTMMVTFSEFGRCAEENGSFGTDHGQVAPMFVVGKGVNAGIYGDCNNLSDLTADGQVKNRQFDYRAVFTTVLQDFLGASDSILGATYFDPYKSGKIPFVGASVFVDPGCYVDSLTPVNEVFDKERAMKIFPNPAYYRAELSYRSAQPFDGRLTVADLSGRTAMSEPIRVESGDNSFDLYLDGFSAGTYAVRLESSDRRVREVGKLVVVR